MRIKVSELKQLAFDQREPPAALDPEERKLYDICKSMYISYAANEIPLEEAEDVINEATLRYAIYLDRIRDEERGIAHKPNLARLIALQKYEEKNNNVNQQKNSREENRQEREENRLELRSADEQEHAWKL